MKKTQTLALVLVLLTGGASFALAETDATVTAGASGEVVAPKVRPMGIIRKEVQEVRKVASTTRAQIKDDVKIMREKASTTRKEIKQEFGDRRKEIEQKRVEIKTDLQNRMGEIIKKQGERVIQRLEAALGRLNNIAGRIDSRIDKLTTRCAANTRCIGAADTTKAKADMVIAKAKIDAAKVKLDAAKIAITGIIGNDGTVATSTPGNLLSGKIKLIKEQVRGVEAALKDAHKALVQVITDLKAVSPKATATTTATVNE